MLPEKTGVLKMIRMTERLFREYGEEVGLNTAVDVARAMGVDAATINHWCNEITAAHMRDIAAIIEEGNRVRAAGMVH